MELLDARGRRIRGYTKEDATPMKGDSLRHPVGWRDPISDRLPAETCLIRIHLNRATVYSVELVP